MTNTADPRIQAIATHYGLEHQLKKLKEELEELTEAIDEHLVFHSVKSLEHLVEESVDVDILIDQLIYLTYREELRRIYREFKLSRQTQRVKDETNGRN